MGGLTTAPAIAVRLLRRAEIVDAVWNNFIDQSPQQVVYGHSWYLDAVSPGWAALVATNHNGQWVSVLPIPLRRKFGFEVIQQPLFCQFLGVFSVPNASTEIASDLLATLPQFFKYNSLYAGRFGRQTDWPAFFEVQFYQNFLLSLRAPYQHIRSGYSRDRLINLKKAEKFGWQIEEKNDIQPLIELFAKNHAAQIEGGVSENAYVLLAHMYEILQQKKAAKLLYALKDGQIEAGALFAIDQHRIVYLFNAASDLGRRQNARTLLIDSIIQSCSNQDLWFDFESPEQPSIAAFYQSFGSQAEPFAQFKYNRLPFGLQKLQRWRLAFLKIINLLPSTSPK